MAELTLTREPDARRFLEVAGPFLEEREAEHNLILGVTANLAESQDAYGAEDAFLAYVRDGDRVVAAAMRTPPYSLALSEVDRPGAIELMARAVHDADAALPGVVGPKQAAATFAGAWRDLTGAEPTIDVEQRIYRCHAVRVPEGVPGAMRRADADDRDLLVEWFGAFMEEALPASMREAKPEDVVRRRLAERTGGLYLWEDGGPVSLAGATGPTLHGIRIGPVYTPPPLRGRGYGSAVTAALTRGLLEGGRGFCYLFTDLTNPTSNRIYERIGYRPVTDVDQWVFAFSTRSS